MAKLFGALFVVLDALMFASVRSSFFDVVFYLLSESLAVDFELSNRPSELLRRHFRFPRGSRRRFGNSPGALR